MERKVISVGIKSGDLTGNTSLPIQAAIDYLSYIGGGTVRIGEGVYEIDTAIHMRSNVILEGVPGKTVLKKSRETVSPLLYDADLHENKIVLENPEGFNVGQTVTVRKAERHSGFFDTVAVITAKEGNVCYLDRDMYVTHFVQDKVVVATIFPVISGYNIENAEIRGITIDGNKEFNSPTNGCRHAGIYLFESFNVVIENCIVHDYNGDGISYQKCRDIYVRDCQCIENEGLGIHPGSGTTHTEIIGCRTVGNGGDGIYLCWRVTRSLVENCVSVRNKGSGLSIGHKDTHNIIRNNEFSENLLHGIFFRNEPYPMGADFNVVENNIVKNNGQAGSPYGLCNIRIRGGTNNVRLANNKIIFENVPVDHTVGICMEEDTFEIFLEGNEFVNCKKEVHTSCTI